MEKNRCTEDRSMQVEVRQALFVCIDQYLQQKVAQGHNPHTVYADLVIGLINSLCDLLATDEMCGRIGPEAVALEGRTCDVPITDSVRDFVLRKTIEIKQLAT